ncbi:hypothetical protein LguiA_013578 [Lonicera macranthoides]
METWETRNCASIRCQKRSRRLKPQHVGFAQGASLSRKPRLKARAFPKYPIDIVFFPESHKTLELTSKSNRLLSHKKLAKWTTVTLCLRISKAFPSVGGPTLRLSFGGEALFKASGTIYETSEKDAGRYLSSIVTYASLIGSSNEDVDIKIEVYIAGGRTFDPNILGYDMHYNVAIINILSDVPLLLRPSSSAFKLCAEEVVVALGRNRGNFDVMIVPDKFCLDDGKYQVDKWLIHFKRYEKFCQPWIGVEATNLYAIKLEELEHIILHNPNVSKGVFVEAFCRKMLNKAGKCVDVDVIKRGYDDILKLNITVEEFTPDRFNS